MTTKVTVEAHCADDTIVVIRQKPHIQTVAIKNGERWEGYVYDEKSVEVFEVKKT